MRYGASWGARVLGWRREPGGAPRIGVHRPAAGGGAEPYHGWGWRASVGYPRTDRAGERREAEHGKGAHQHGGAEAPGAQARREGAAVPEEHAGAGERQRDGDGRPE